MRKSVSILFFALIIGLMVAGPVDRVLARRGRGKHHGREYKQEKRGRERGRPRRIRRSEFFRYCPELELTEEQKSTLREKRREWRLEALDSRTQLKKKRIELNGLLAEKDVNMPRIRQRVNSLHDLRAELHIARLEHRKEMREVLTDKQRDKLPPGLSRGFGWRRGRHRMIAPRHRGPGRRMMGPEHRKRGRKYHRDRRFNYPKKQLKDSRK